MSLISVLVAAYNAERTLPKCLDSLLGQSLSDIEVLCVDDASTDNTLNILYDYSQKDSRIKVFHSAINQGQAVARNKALSHATAPYVCMVDADDWLSGDALEAALDVFGRHPHTDCVMLHLIQYFENAKTKDEQLQEICLPKQLLTGGCLTGKEAFRLSIDGWKLHGLYVTRTKLHRKYPFDTSTRLYSDDNTTHLHFLHSREVRACDGKYFYRKHISLTSHFNILHFDYIEANYALRQTLLKEHVEPECLSIYERHRWENFIVCYRSYLKNYNQLTTEQQKEVKTRFKTILTTFSISDLPKYALYKLGYIYVPSFIAFDWQQRIYLIVKRMKDRLMGS